MSLSVKSTPSEFKALNEHRDDLVSWQKTPEGKATLAKSRESAGFGKKCNKGGNGGSNGKRKDDGNQNPSTQKKWLRKQYAKKPEGIMKHIMSLLPSRAEGEKETTSALISTLSSVAITPAAPVPPPASGKAPAISSVNAKLNGSATVMTLNSIMRKGGE